MFSGAYDILKLEAESLRGYLSATHLMRAALANAEDSLEPSLLEASLYETRRVAPDTARWRVMEHSLVVGRLYALYENYCERLLTDWIEFLTSQLSFEKLPQNIIDNYPHGFSTIVGMLPSQRYALLTTQDLVAKYHSALQGDSSYSLTPECLIHHKNNLRWADLFDLFKRCGVSDLDGWIEGSNVMSSHFSDGDGRIVDQAKSKLFDFIQYRNDSSHGAVSADEILGYDELIDVIDFILNFGKALDQFVRWKMIEVLLKEGVAKQVGRITEVFNRANSFICVTKKIRLKVGQRLYIKKAGNLLTNEILSIQLEGKNIPELDATDGTEVGLMIGVLPSQNSDVYLVEA